MSSYAQTLCLLGEKFFPSKESSFPRVACVMSTYAQTLFDPSGPFPCLEGIFPLGRWCIFSYAQTIFPRGFLKNKLIFLVHGRYSKLVEGGGRFLVTEGGGGGWQVTSLLEEGRRRLHRSAVIDGEDKRKCACGRFNG
jgi:hypothetical protein